MTKLLWDRRETSWPSFVLALAFGGPSSRELRFSVSASDTGMLIADSWLRDGSATPWLARHLRRTTGSARYVAWADVAGITPRFDEGTRTLLRVTLVDGGTIDLSTGHLPMGGRRRQQADERFRLLFTTWWRALDEQSGR